MDASWFSIDPDVRTARTPPPEMYGDPGWHAQALDRVWARAWMLLEAVGGEEYGSNVVATSLLGEPLLFTRTEGGREHLLSNVCTHRGAVMVDGACRLRHLRCPYHGRRFRLDGTVAGAPGFDGEPGFPEPRDHLPRSPLAAFGPWRFGVVAAEPALPAEDWLRPLRERLPWVAWDALTHAPAGERHHHLAASWALYVENYLEGFHIPFVHPGLAKVLDSTAYRTELLPFGTLQVGVAQAGAPAHHPPAGDPDHGTPIGGYYFWLFPGTMVNLYPWGVSLNQVEPVGPRATVVHYRTWVFGSGAPDPDVDTVELEDQAIIARVQAGIGARRYPGGRYSPTEERGTHHFHRLLASVGSSVGS